MTVIVHPSALPIGNIERDCPELTKNEWSLLCDILNCTLLDKTFALGLHHEIIDSDEDGTGENWGVTLKEFASRIEGLSVDARCAILQVVYQFWKATDSTGNHLDRLISAGAKIRT